MKKEIYSKKQSYKFVIEDEKLNAIYLGPTYESIKEDVIILPDCVKIVCKNAFSYCHPETIQKIVLPSSIEKIENGAFHCFDGIFEIDNQCKACCFDSGILYSFDKTRVIKATKNVCKDNLIIPEGVIEVGKMAFYELHIKSVLLPNSLLVIEDCAFFNCDLHSVSFPENLKRIENDAFALNCIEKIFIPENCTSVSKSAFDYNCIININVDVNKKK